MSTVQEECAKTEIFQTKSHQLLCSCRSFLFSLCVQTASLNKWWCAFQHLIVLCRQKPTLPRSSVPHGGVCPSVGWGLASFQGKFIPRPFLSNTNVYRLGRLQRIGWCSHGAAQPRAGHLVGPVVRDVVREGVQRQQDGADVGVDVIGEVPPPNVVQQRAAAGRLLAGAKHRQ